MILYMNRELGTLLIAYYDDKMKIRIEYYGFYHDEWQSIDDWHQGMDTLRKEILKAGKCDILYDDGEL